MVHKVRDDRDPRACSLCGLPEGIGRHRFVVIHNMRPITVCEPGYSPHIELQEARRRCEVFRDLLASTIEKDLLGFWKRFMKTFLEWKDLHKRGLDKIFGEFVYAFKPE